MVALLASCHRQEVRTSAASEPPPVSVKVVQIRAETFAATVAVTGTLVSKVQVDVKAETTGHVVRFDKQEGDPVTAGEPVVWMDEENYRLALRQAESAVQVSESALERARVLESHACAELERARNLMKSGGITDKDRQAAEVAEQDAHAQRDLAAAQREQARAALDVARKRLRDAVVRAPVSGQLQKKFVNSGAYVEPATAVFSIVDNRRLELESPVPAAELAPIRAGQRVSFSVNSYPGESFAGRVAEINPAIDSQTRSAKVRVAVENSGGKLKAGMFTEGEILTGVNAQALLIPASAIYRDDRSAQGPYVFVVENNKTARRPLGIGRERGTRVEITSGLRPGDLLIAEQSIELAEGVSVAPRQ